MNNLNKVSKLTVLGIDPGYGRLGIAIVERAEGIDTLIHSECFETDAKEKQEVRLGLIAKKVSDVIKKFKPDVLATEKLYFGKNSQTAIKVGEARGVVLSAAGAAGLPVKEYAPSEIKLAVTGYGNADKRAVLSMVLRLIKMSQKNRVDDELDAIAVALTHTASERYPQ